MQIDNRHGRIASDGIARVAVEPVQMAVGRGLVPFLWFLTLFASILPEILADRLAGRALPWIYPARIALFGALLLVSFAWKPARPLRGFAALWLIVFGGSALLSGLDFRWPALEEHLGDTPWVRRMQPEQFSKFALTLLVAAGLLVLGTGRRALYLAPGRLDAPIRPVRWMGFPKPDSWVRFGGQFGIYIPLGMAFAAWLVSRPSPELWARVFPALPAILLFAAMNAFYEEMTYRASMLAVLEPYAGTGHAWAMSALYFGIAHFYGVPYGWLGVALATFNGWLLGKAMLETRGMFWAWWMHFLQDVAIFIFLVMGALTPGGG